MSKIRVRFAPSPTGPLHMGGVRTALFNYLFAKKHGGDFLLRIEDTDQKRFVEGAEEYVMKSLEWCGIKVDEGIKEGGNFGPYKQSERKNIYQEYIKTLLSNGSAYYAFDTPEELDAMRERLEKSGSSVRQYNSQTRGDMKNSFTMTEEDVNTKINSGEPYVIRFNIPENENLVVKDIIRGDVKVNTSQLDDKVLFKADGLPTYHFANIVDDHLMQISHVIRGEEWLPSLPLHVLLYRSFGWEDEMPQFAHLPLLLKPSGKGKLSKRDGAKLGFPVFPLEWNDKVEGEVFAGYKEDGYLPEAFVNMIALLGWNPGDEREIYSIEELTEKFDLTKVQKGGARFSPDKAHWFNQQYIKEKSNKDLVKYFKPILLEKEIKVEDNYLEKVIDLVKERVVLIPDFWTQSAFFFETPIEYNTKVVKKRWKEDAPATMQQIHDVLQGVETDSFTTEKTEDAVKKFIEENELNFGKVLNPFRLLLTGTGGGPHLFDIISTIGKDETLLRLENGIKNIKR